uniref:ornithine decarboxylase n=1 Tax=Acrobeloides nanus TaxID=290746 RepID=A0A914CPH5_9BILA
MNYRFERIGGSKVAVFDRNVDNVTMAKIIAENGTKNNIDEAFGLMNLNTVVKYFNDWKSLLPRIEPFYAVKCNDDPILLKVLADLGAGFDCASKEEINMILHKNLVPPEKIIFANPCKSRSFIEHAQKFNVTMMTFDSEEELVKIQEIYKDSKLILRIRVIDHSATIPLGLKFGCEPSEAALYLLQKAADMGLQVIGISFHVGTGCNDPTVFEQAVKYSKNLFEVGKSLGHNMHLLDIGGGFPGNNREKFEKFARIIRSCTDKYFPASTENVRIVAEPGRYFAAACVSIVAKIISTVKVPASRITNNDTDSDKEGYMYYINDGVYGSFNCVLTENWEPFGRPLFDSDKTDDKEYPTIVWGPTGDSLDKVESHKNIRRMQENEWLHYENIGAYSNVLATQFNGFKPPQYSYFIDNSTWKFIYSKTKDIDSYNRSNAKKTQTYGKALAKGFDRLIKKFY